MDSKIWRKDRCCGWSGILFPTLDCLIQLDIVILMICWTDLLDYQLHWLHLSFLLEQVRLKITFFWKFIHRLAQEYLLVNSSCQLPYLAQVYQSIFPFLAQVFWVDYSRLWKWQTQECCLFRKNLFSHLIEVESMIFFSRATRSLFHHRIYQPSQEKHSSTAYVFGK